MFRSYALFSLLLVPALASADEAGVVAVVTSLNAGLEGVLRESAKLNYQQRYDKLDPILAESFDLEFMARQAVGRQWDELSPEDQKRWVSAFRQLTTATYASRLTNYAGQKFETQPGAESASHETMTVRSKVIEPGHDDIELTYRVHQVDGRWKVIDVYLKGSVSEIALRRSEYSSVLKRDGFPGLMDAVEKRVAALAAGAPAPSAP